MIDSLAPQLALLPAYLGGHVRLAVAALLAGAIASFALGLLSHRFPVLQSPVVGLASVVQTIPGLALLAVMVPLLGRIGFLPAFLALTLYSMLPILRNTVVGIAEVPAAVVEAARGVGMTEGQMLWRVQLPLAAPVLLAGVRTAAAWTVGMATLATPVGALSLGNFIFSGLQTRNTAAIVVGCAASAALAIVLDLLLRGVESGVRRRRPGLAWGMTAGFVAVGAVGLVGAGGGHAGAGGEASFRIGGKPFTEQYILTDLLALQIERRTKVTAERVPNLGSTVAFDALVAGQIDAYVDYSGTIWTTILKHASAPPGAAGMLAEITAALREQHGIEVIGALGFENAYGLAMLRDRAAALRVATVSDLRRSAAHLRFGADLEFLGRDEYASLGRSGIAFGDVRAMDASLLYRAVAEGELDVITAYTTEGKVAAYDLQLLTDDADVFPPYDALLLVSARAAVRAPGAIAALREVVGRIGNDAMLRANWRVDEGGRPIHEVASELLATALGEK
jgi:osmoprotectant transport system permease protein